MCRRSRKRGYGEGARDAVRYLRLVAVEGEAQGGECCFVDLLLDVCLGFVQLDWVLGAAEMGVKLVVVESRRKSYVWIGGSHYVWK